MLLLVHKYDLKVQYISGKNLLSADALSGLNKQACCDDKLIDDAQLYVDVVI